MNKNQGKWHKLLNCPAQIYYGASLIVDQKRADEIAKDLPKTARNGKCYISLPLNSAPLNFAIPQALKPELFMINFKFAKNRNRRVKAFRKSWKLSKWAMHTYQNSDRFFFYLNLPILLDKGFEFEKVFIQILNLRDQVTWERELTAWKNGDKILLSIS
jgi:hypothetical protein